MFLKTKRAVHLEEDNSAYLIFYENPSNEELEFEIPLIRWSRYLKDLNGEKKLRRMAMAMGKQGNP